MAKKKTSEATVRYGVYLRAEQIAALERIHQDTGVPVAHLIRCGVDRELAARGAKAKGARHER